MSCLCDQCAALCCRYFALPIDNPDCRQDYDNIRWYLLHQNVVVFVETKQWYIAILNRCRELQSDNRCGIYETRPAICRSYTTANCDYHAGDYGYDQLFTSADAFWAYALQTLAEQRKTRGSKAKLKRGKSRSTVARQLSQTRKLRLEVPDVQVGLPKAGNGRSLALPLLSE